MDAHAFERRKTVDLKLDAGCPVRMYLMLTICVVQANDYRRCLSLFPRLTSNSKWVVYCFGGNCLLNWGLAHSSIVEHQRRWKAQNHVRAD